MDAELDNLFDDINFGKDIDFMLSLQVLEIQRSALPVGLAWHHAGYAKYSRPNGGIRCASSIILFMIRQLWMEAGNPCCRCEKETRTGCGLEKFCALQ